MGRHSHNPISTYLEPIITNHVQTLGIVITRSIANSIASSEIQDEEQSGNFYKLVLLPRKKKKKKVIPVPQFLVLVPTETQW